MPKTILIKYSATGDKYLRAIMGYFKNKYNLEITPSQAMEYAIINVNFDKALPTFFSSKANRVKTVRIGGEAMKKFTDAKLNQKTIGDIAFYFLRSAAQVLVRRDKDVSTRRLYALRQLIALQNIESKARAQTENNVSTEQTG